MDRDEIRDVALEKLGRVTARGATGEYAMLARLLDDDEPIEAMALARPPGVGLLGAMRMVVATPARILLLAKTPVMRRELIDEIGWDEITGASAEPPDTLTIERTGGPLRLTLVVPPSQLAALVDLVRARTGATAGGRTGYVELRELATRKLGRLIALGANAPLLVLAEALEPGESVLDLAYTSTGDPGGVLAITSRRLVHVPSAGSRAGEPVSIGFDELRAVELSNELTLTLETAAGAHVFEQVVPAERAQGLVVRLRARTGEEPAPP